MTLTPYSVKIAPAARDQILLLSTKQQKIVVKLIETLAVNPRPPGTIKIEGLTGLYREELDHIHVIYKVEDQEILLLLVRMAGK